MTWTTENDPPPPRPVPGSPATDDADQKTPDDTVDAESTLLIAGSDPDDTETNLFPDGGDAIEQDLDSDIEAIDSLVDDAEGGDSNLVADKPSGLDQDGPLDPSVFDGLFDDLATDSETDEDAAAFDQAEDDSNANVDRSEVAPTTTEQHVYEAQTSGQQPSDTQSSEAPTSGQQPSDTQSSETDLSQQNSSLDSFDTDRVDPGAPSQDPAEAPLRSNDRWTMPSPAPTEALQTPRVDVSPINDRTGAATPVSPNEAAPLPQSGLFSPDVHPGVEPPARFQPAGEVEPPTRFDPADEVELPTVQSQAEPNQPVSFEDHRKPSPDLRPQAPRPPSTSSRRNTNWIGIAAAIALGSALGLVGTFLLSSLRDSPEDTASSETQPENAPDETTTDDAGLAESETTVGQERDVQGDSVATTFGADAIQFSAGTSDLADQDLATLDRLAEILAASPETTATISVRSYSAETSAANYDLSLAQSGAITNYLTGAGVSEEQFSVVPRGSAPFRPSQPVDGFVVVNPGIGQSDFKARLGVINPFAVGLEPGTSSLRPASVAALDQVGEAMTAIESARLTLAAYSFSESSAETNKARASQAAQVASQYLQLNHGIAPGRISTIAPGIAEYQIDSAWSNHVEIKIEDGSTPAFDIASLDASSLTFESNSERITAEGQAVLDQIAAVLASSGATLVVEVFAFSAADSQANDQLSKAQANSINSYLTAKGVSELQIRTFGGGAAKQFEVVETPTTVVLSVVD